jgi:hypothetical protein
MHLRLRHVTLVALVALAACSSGSDASTGSEPATPVTPESSESAASTVATTEPLVSNTAPPTEPEPTEPEPTEPTVAETTEPESTASDTTEPTVASASPMVATDPADEPEPVEPIRLPEREIRPINAMVPPLEPVGTSSGDATSRAQWRLLELGFWLQAPDGRFDNTTQQAVMAFQKYYGLETDGSLGPITAAKLSEIDELPMGSTTTGTLVEVDKSRQLVFLVNDGVTTWILNTSTGTEIPYDTINKNTGEREAGDSVTRTGVFAVNRQREEGWWAGDLGEIYRPKYFSGGIALHGSNYIPAYPASHGCVRLSTSAMDYIWDQDLVPMGTTVWVHGQIPGADA